MNEPITKEQLQKRFTDDVARRHGGGATMTRVQARMAACRQLARDVKNSELNRDDVLELIVSQEIDLGSTPEAAKVYAQALLEGREAPKIERDMGMNQRGNRQVG
jgi:hypothetical protein